MSEYGYTPDLERRQRIGIDEAVLCAAKSPAQIEAIVSDAVGREAAMLLTRLDPERFAAALDSIGIENDIHIYDEVNHGFWLHVDQDVEARGPAALDAWERLKAYLNRTLGQ